ncbi:alpha-glucosidase [Spirosoma soli]|uniref:Alpha-glucosidase n=1 Tax=Spirosoma soli TaxID=1770529 RepID=A0ABW5M1D8_9BACT
MPDFRSSIIYQIYPRSFNDSDGDGEGDLMGIIQKLDYLHDLGVDILWLSPIFQSPNADNGYDVSDYEAIQPAFGTMDDFDELLAGVHKRGMKLVLDLVVNHSSDEHPWFVESRKGKDNPYRDYYIWRAPKDGGFPNDWVSIFSGPAWTFDEATGEYYLHLFLDKQPDLNWENPKLRQDVYKMMRFWFDKGVDGFRMDVIPFLSKDQSFPNYPPGRFADASVYANGPRIHEFLQEMNREVLSRYDRGDGPPISIGEGIGVTAELANLYVGKDRHELDMIYHFDHAVPRDEHHFLKRAPEFTLLELKRVFDTWNVALEQEGGTGKGWQNIYFGNHDNPRVVSRFGDVEHYHYESATMLATVLLTQRGTPTIYQGDEIGMTNCQFNSIHEFNDVQVLNAYKALSGSAEFSDEAFLKSVNYIARDHARTPMQWFNERNAGFTTGRPWLNVNLNYTKINVADQQVRDDSILSFYKRLTRWRRKTPAIWDGTYNDLLPNHPTVWAYERVLDEERIVVLANFSDDEVYVPQVEAGEVILSNYASQSFTLQPFEARILVGY